jgi:hypothetical protein
MPPIADCRMVAFKYSPVESTRTIRLLELFQETDGFNSPIICAIGHFSLDDEKVQYRALSYCWGDDAKPHTIYINGKRSDVTANLYSALLRLRTNYFCCCKHVCSCARSSQHPETLDEHFTSPQPPWIDALCLYFDRYRIEYLRNLRFGPFVFRGFRLALVALIRRYASAIALGVTWHEKCVTRKEVGDTGWAGSREPWWQHFLFIVQQV